MSFRTPVSKDFPTFSVVISTYNYGQFLSQAIDSVLKQTFNDYEIIVVNDGSTDNTDEIIKSHLDNPKLRYYKKENGGQASAKNYGIRNARGIYIAFLDADDCWEADKLEKQLGLFKSHQDRVGVVFSHVHVIGPAGEHIPSENPSRYKGNVLYWLYGDNFICFSSSCVKRSLLQAHGMFDEALKMGIDYDLWLRLSLVTEFDYVPEPLVAYRTGHGQMSSSLEGRAYWAQLIEDRFEAEHPYAVTKTMKKRCQYEKAFTRFRNFEVRDKGMALRALLKMLVLSPLSIITYKSIVRFIVVNVIPTAKRSYP